MVFEYQGIKIHWLRHAGFWIEFDNYNIYIDPYELFRTDYPKADIVFITHEHFDHCDPDSLKILVKSGTIIVMPEIAKNCLKGIKDVRIEIVKPNECRDLGIIKFCTIPSYNTTKFRAPGKVYHPKEDGRVGYIIEIKGVRIYHAGDTDVIPEMKELEGKIDIALLPVSGTYVMTAEEAVDAVKLIKPKIAIPMHYGTIVGTVKDAEKFKQLAQQYTQVVILESEDEKK